MKSTALLLSLLLLSAGAADARKHGKPNRHGKRTAHYSHTHAARPGAPPGLAKHGGLPPGLAKRLSFPARAPRYVVFDPRYDDRAWYLAGDRWVLQRSFDVGLRREVRYLLAAPYVPMPPPIPLPLPRVSLRVYLFD